MSFFKRLICKIRGHKYRVLRAMNPGARKVGCNRCGKCWGMHDATRAFVPWDSDLEALYSPGSLLDPATDPRNHFVGVNNMVGKEGGE